MLVLSRKKDEKILIRVPGLSQDIEIIVARIDRGRVRIGVEASPEVIVLREEIANSAEIH